MTILAPKRSSESVLYRFDWTRELAPTGDTIQAYTLTVASGSITVPVADQDFDATEVRALIVGGADAETATLLLTVTTNAGQVLKRDLSILIDDGAQAVWPSTGTKRQAVEMAFEEIGLAGYEFDATAEEQASALRRLDTLMGEWAGPGMNLDVGYAFPAAVGDSDMSDVIGVPDFALNAVAISLALRIMPAIGKTMSGETRVALNSGMSAIRAAFCPRPERVLTPSTLRGAGAKPFSTWTPFNGAGNGGPR